MRIVDFEFESNSKRIVILVEYFRIEYRILAVQKTWPFLKGSLQKYVQAGLLTLSLVHLANQLSRRHFDNVHVIHSPCRCNNIPSKYYSLNVLKPCLWVLSEIKVSEQLCMLWEISSLVRIVDFEFEANSKQIVVYPNIFDSNIE